jgi:hypothetical protein
VYPPCDPPPLPLHSPVRRWSFACGWFAFALYCGACGLAWAASSQGTAARAKAEEAAVLKQQYVILAAPAPTAADYAAVTQAGFIGGYQQQGAYQQHPGYGVYQQQPGYGAYPPGPAGPQQPLQLQQAPSVWVAPQGAPPEGWVHSGGVGVQDGLRQVDGSVAVSQEHLVWQGYVHPHTRQLPTHATLRHHHTPYRTPQPPFALVYHPPPELWARTRCLRRQCLRRGSLPLIPHPSPGVPVPHGAMVHQPHYYQGPVTPTAPPASPDSSSPTASDQLLSPSRTASFRSTSSSRRSQGRSVSSSLRMMGGLAAVREARICAAVAVVAVVGVLVGLLVQVTTQDACIPVCAGPVANGCGWDGCVPGKWWCRGCGLSKGDRVAWCVEMRDVWRFGGCGQGGAR